MKLITLLRERSGVDEEPFLIAVKSMNISYINFDDSKHIWYDAHSFSQRLIRRILRPFNVMRFNRDVYSALKINKPSHLVVFNNPTLTPKIMQLAKKLKIKTTMIYPDLDPTVHGRNFVKAFKLFDEVYFTKPNLVDHFKSINPESQLIHNIYNPFKLNEIKPINPDIGVLFVGHHSNGKESFLFEFCSKYKDRVTIVGDRWNDAMFELPNVKIHNAIYGNKAINMMQTAVCCLGLLQEKISKGTMDDVVTTRTNNVPCYGGILIHPKNKYSEIIFGKNNILLFSTVDDAVQISRMLKSDPVKRLSLWKNQQKKVINNSTNPVKLMDKILT